MWSMKKSLVAFGGLTPLNTTYVLRSLNCDITSHQHCVMILTPWMLPVVVCLIVRMPFNGSSSISRSLGHQTSDWQPSKQIHTSKSLSIP
ncbi:hypothetical protein EV424DRAFT_314899 [Suillus variegatus]|nr:hypothetical protein EV424DRAFT_314899 [Suillus variegatus]